MNATKYYRHSLALPFEEVNYLTNCFQELIHSSVLFWELTAFPEPHSKTPFSGLQLRFIHNRFYRAFASAANQRAALNRGNSKWTAIFQENMESLSKGLPLIMLFCTVLWFMTLTVLFVWTGTLKMMGLTRSVWHGKQDFLCKQKPQGFAAPVSINPQHTGRKLSISLHLFLYLSN